MQALTASLKLFIFRTGSHLLTEEHSLHRRRRKPLEPFFSRMGIQRLQPMLADVALKLEERLKKLSGTGKVVRLDHAYSAFSGDIIGRICLGSRNTNEFLDDPEFAPHWYTLFAARSQLYTDCVHRYDVIHAIVRSIPLFTGFPSIVQ
jgi:cytochrome P450